MSVKEWLEGLAGTNTSSEKDSSMMQSLLRRIGFSSAVVTVGIVYPEGHGQPLDIHTMAKMMLKKA